MKNIKIMEKNKKNYISLILIIIGLIIISILIKGIIDYQDDDYNYLLDDENIKELSFSCDLLDPLVTDENTVKYYPYETTYGVGDDVYCRIDSDQFSPTDISLTYYNEDNPNIDLVTILTPDRNWKIEPNLKEIINEYTIKANDTDSKLNRLFFKFHIKNNENITDNKYKFTFSIITLKKGYEEYKAYGTNIELDMKSNYRLKFTKDKVEAQKLNNNKSYEKTYEFNCNNCNIYAPQNFIYQDYENGRAMISSTIDNLMLFDFNKGILGTYSSAYWLYSQNERFEEGTYMYVAKKGNDKYGIIDKDGKVIKDYVLSKMCYGNQLPQDCLSYSVEGDVIAEKKNNKYGIIKITSNDVVMDYKYDDIKILNSKYFKTKEADKWYIYNLKTREKQIQEGFDIIYKITNNILIVPKNGYWYFINYNNEVINSFKMDEEYKYISYLVEREDNNIIYIYTHKDEDGREEPKEKYIYNVKDNKLEKEKTN